MFDTVFFDVQATLMRPCTLKHEKVPFFGRESVFLCFCARKKRLWTPSNAAAYNRPIRYFFRFFSADLSYVGFVLVGDVLDIQR